MNLTEIRAAVDKKFAPTEVDLEDGKAPVVLNHPLRLDAKVRARLGDLSSTLEEEGVDQGAVIEALLVDAARVPADGKRLVKALGGDVAILMAVLEEWIKDNTLGEASPSES